jgi:hypothetical protein
VLVDTFYGERLLRVILIDEPPQRVPVKVQAIELYDDGVGVRWMIPGPSPDWSYDTDEDTDDHWPHLRLRDDIGTRFVPRTGHGGGGDSYRGEMNFTPAVPKDASALEVLGLAYPIEVPLR